MITKYCLVFPKNLGQTQNKVAQSVSAVEYTDCISAEG